MIISCVGDCGIDDYVDDGIKRPGGITLNFAVHAKHVFPHNDSIEVITALGDKEDSELVLSTIKKYNISPIIEKRVGAAPVQYIKRNKSGEKKFAGYNEGVLKNFTLSAKQKEHIAQSDFLIIPLYEQIEAFFNSVITEPTKGIVSVDFMDLSDYQKMTTIVSKYIKALDIAFFGLSLSDADLLTSLQQLSKESGKLFVITLGKDGSLVFDKGKKIYQSTIPITHVVDTTGAGDAFAAAFVKEYLYKSPLKACLQKANLYAGQITQQLGTF